jgi:hypothetical protein
MGDEIGAFGAVVLASIFWFVVLLFSVNGAYNVGYEQAYKDMHTGKIESVVQRDYPAVWIKYNVTEPKR